MSHFMCILGIRHGCDFSCLDSDFSEDSSLVSIRAWKSIFSHNLKLACTNIFEGGRGFQNVFLTFLPFYTCASVGSKEKKMPEVTQQITLRQKQ